MTNETNRRAVLGGAIAAGAAGATAVLPAAASSGPQLSAIDRKVIDLWQRRQQMIAASEDECFDPSEAEEEAWGEEFCDVVRQIDKQIGASVLALGAVLMGAIRDGPLSRSQAFIGHASLRSGPNW